MIAMSFVTVVIVNWNSWDYLFPCLEGLYQQTWQDFEVLVVDNASTDQAPAARLGRFPRLRYVRNQENRGFAAANNQAIRSSASPWVLLLNPDTIPDRRCLERLARAVATHPGYVSFGCRLLLASDPDRLDGTGDVYHMSGLAWRAGHGQGVETADDRPQEIFSPCAAAALYRREAVLACGGFDEDFFCYNEDVDLGFRLRLLGHRALSVPGAVVLHHGSGTTAVRSDFAVYHGHRNLVWTWWKDMPAALLMLFFPVHVVYNIACVALYVCRGQGAVILRAKIDALKGLPTVWRKRRTVQAGRRCTLRDVWNTVNRSLIIGRKSNHRRRTP